jgi:hypothetical protein
MKNGVIYVLAGALLGVATASFVVPPMVSWYMTPGGVGNGAAMVQIPETIRYATTFLLKGQAIGAGVGAVLGLILAVATRKKPAPAPAIPPTT